MSTIRQCATYWRISSCTSLRSIHIHRRTIISMTRPMENHETSKDTMDCMRTYDKAIEIINARKRLARPKEGNAKTTSTGSSNPTPDARGTPGIEGMSLWLDVMGHSQVDIGRLNVVHVAGTKGKGSTCAFTDAFLRAHGQRTGFPRKTGLYTSPHLLVPEERIRIGSRPLPEKLFAKYFFEVYERLPQLAAPFDPSQDILQRGPGYLQLFALLAIHVFIREKVDVAVFETHCGGEYDATTVVEKPVVTAVTTLGMDHISMLGPTICNIAWHKGGIYKPGATALSAPQDDACAKVLKQRGKKKGEEVHFVDIDSRLPENSLSLRPEVQKVNASVAVAAAQAFLDRCAPKESRDLTIADVRAGVEHFSWPGRFQVLKEEQWTWYLDAAHNDMSVKIAAKWFAEVVREDMKNPGRPRILIFSHINELRDSAELLRSLGEALVRHGVHMDHVIFSSYDESDARKSHQAPESPDLFHETWKKIDPRSNVRSEPTIQGAIRLARQLDPKGIHALITGSQHLVGPSLRILGWTPKAKG